MRVVTIASHKGGSAKTTTAVALARLLSKQAKVLLIDTDMQCNASESFLADNELVEYKDYNLFNVLNGETLARNALEINANLVLVPSSAKLAQVSNLPGEFLKEVLHKQANEYDYVIVDSGPHMSNINLLAICAADDIIVPIPLSRFGLTSIEKVATWIEAVNPNAHILGYLPTMYDKRKTNQRDNYYSMIKTYEGKVLPAIPHRATIELIINVPDDKRIEEGLSYYSKLQELILNAETTTK